MLVQSYVAEKHRPREQHRRGIGLVFALDVETHMPTARFEDCHFAAHVASWHDAGSAHQASTDVGQYATVQIRHHHHIELLWSGNALHRCVIHNHVVDCQRRILLGHMMKRVSEQTVGQLHYVRLMNTRHLLPVVGQGKTEGEFGDPFGFGTRDDL